MRVVLGKAGKSRVLEDQMKQLKSERTLLIDAVGVKALSQLAGYTIETKSFAELIATFEHLEKDNDLIGKIENIVLELNTGIEDTSVLLKWEQRLNKRFFVTVQDNEMDRIMLFDMTLPE